jgi:hypothetical protein
MVLSLGQTVLYCLTVEDVARIETRRALLREESNLVEETNCLFDYGNRINEGDIFPMLIVRVSPHPNKQNMVEVNGQVFLDGNDCLWITSRTMGDKPGDWFEPPRV